MPPTVSVIVTCYNLGRFLDEAVDSVLAQTYPDFDILVVDDGSTDPETVELLRTYQKPRTRVVRIENRGLPGARNEGVRQTSGKYVCALDADDRLAPTYLEKSVAVLDSRPDIAFVSHWLRTFGDDEQDWTPASSEFPALLDMNTINGAALTRREALMAVGLSDESMRRGCEDWDLWIGMVERGYRGHIIPEVLFHYRQRADSMSRDMMRGDTHVELYRYIVGKHLTSFAAHAAALVARREIDRMAVLAEAHDLQMDCDSALMPEIERTRDAARTAARAVAACREREAQVERAEADRLELEAQTERAEADRRELEAQVKRAEADHARDRDAAARALADQRDAYESQLNGRDAVLHDRDTQVEALVDHAGRLEAEMLRDRDGIAGLQFEIRMIRSSLSWRLTRPLRAVYSRLFER